MLIAAADLISCGGAGDDMLVGGDEHDVLCGLGGRDTLFGGAGADYLLGGDGADVLRAGDDTGVNHCGTDDLCDWLEGGRGDDLLDGEGGGSPDTAMYPLAERGMPINLTRGTARGQGYDTLISIDGVRICCSSQPTDDRVVGTVRNDSLDTGSGIDIVRGRAGDDYIFDHDDGVPIGGDTFRGGPGDDTLAGDQWDDRLYGGTGVDTAAAGEGRDKCVAIEAAADCEC